LRTHSDEFYRELTLLRQLNHPNIIRLFGWKISSDKTVGILFIDKFQSTLEEHLENVGPLDEHDALPVMLQMIDALIYMHDLGISHSDIKPENVSYDPISKVPFIFDFGFGVQVEAPVVTTSTGSPLYMSPEIFTRVPHDPFKADLWSVGMTFYEMVTAVTPYDDCENLQQIFGVMQGIDSKLHVPEYLSRGLVRILRGLLRWEPEKRMSLKEVKKSLLELIGFKDDK